MPFILAHGALGPYDELIFGGVAVIFIVMMGISWVKSRNTTPPLDTETERVAAESKAAQPAESPDRFRLD